MVTFALWARSDLKAASVRSLLTRLHEQNYLSPSTLIEVIAIISVRPRFDAIAGEEAVRAKAQIEREDDVASRASLYAQLARAILPVSAPDATAYFRAGLEQFDAIGSGDYDFTNELLLFASSVRGDELSDKDAHTLTNICELNMSSEESKFPWASFATAMSRTSGPRALAKLSRWHDRGKIGLDYTLLPYLTALLRDDKLDPEDALSLNRLAGPVELWACNTEAFANALHEKRSSNARATIAELIQQYEDNHPGIPSEGTVKTLATIAGDVLGKRHTTTRRLSSAYRRYEMVTHDLNEQSNYHPSSGKHLSRLPSDDDPRTEAAVQQLAISIDPFDEASVCDAIGQIGTMQKSRELEQKFFDRLRARVNLSDRSKYIELIARLEPLGTNAKFNELTQCKEEWASSSAVLEATYRNLAAPILAIHAEEFLRFDTLSRSMVKRVSDLAGVTVSALTHELVKILAVPDWVVPAAAWLGVASNICEDADEGQGQKALARLLNSKSATLTSTVVDGPWTPGLYPAGDIPAIASGLVWQALGSPRGSDRWQAAHSVRCFAKFGRWEVIDALVARLHSRDSKGFQAQELPFYYLHARLWLLIALARVALDSPERVAVYARSLKKVALDRNCSHIVMRYVAARALLICAAGSALDLPSAHKQELETIGESPFSPLEGPRDNAHNDFYRGRPDSVPDHEFKFSLDYDFNKCDVHNLAAVFDVPGWKVGDLIREQVRKRDPNVSSMYDNAGRETSERLEVGRQTSSIHVYGQYLAWHALLLVAGRLLEERPTRKDWSHDKPWDEWIDQRLLTRRDGLWLSDGMDRPPLRTRLNVLEEGKDGLVLTGDQKRLTSLVGIDGHAIGDEVIVQGDWKSPDGISVHVSSALVSARTAKRLVKQLIEEEPFFVWLPTLEHDDDEGGPFGRKKQEFEPWIVSPSTEGGRLDEHDPLGATVAEMRPRFVAKIVNQFALKSGDPFRRSWKSSGRKIVAMADAWRSAVRDEDGSETGDRMICKSVFLSEVLDWRNTNLLVLIKLRRYEKAETRYSNGRFSHTVAVLRIMKDRRFEYFPGAVNQIHKSR